MIAITLLGSTLALGRPLASLNPWANKQTNAAGGDQQPAT